MIEQVPDSLMDMYTLHVEHAVLLGLFTILALINSRLHQGARGAYWFPAFTFFALVGAVLVALRGYISDPVSIVFGMLTFHLAYLVLQHCLNDFLDRGSVLRWTMYVQVTVVCISAIGLVEYGFIHPNTSRRLVLYSLVFTLQMMLIAWTMFRNSRRLPDVVMGVVVALLGINNLIRALITLYGGAPADYLKGGLSLQLSLLETTVLQGGIVVSFVWMTAGALHERLDQLASTDPLTGLLNRRALEMAAEREIALSRRLMRPLTAILIDLDRFKEINDSYGHPFGDRTLRRVAHCLESHMRKCDLLARMGGDEFAVLLHNTTRDEAMVIAERLRTELEDLVVSHGEAEARVSASFGLAQAVIQPVQAGSRAESDSEDWNALIQRCDKALYEVKQTGGNLALAS